MSSGNQAREFGLTQKGMLAPGKDADMVVLDKNFNLQGTFSLGNLYTPQ